jgi:uncharacterized protein
MNPSPLEYVESLNIGMVEFVSPDEIKASLDIEAPESVALNTGTPRPFPRVNSYVLIPSDEGYLVAQVEWLTIERSPYPKRRGMQDFGLVDLPYPLRKMSLNPLGTLRKDVDTQGEESYHFRRGADTLPSVGDNVLLPTQAQLLAIVESGEKKRVQIGTSPLAGNARVLVDPNRLFGRHLAVLGNTGSGKSCSVAGLIRWSLDAAEKESEDGIKPNARFIVLDPNGEYSKAFQDFPKARIFTVAPVKDSKANALHVPVWFWNSEEWSAFTQASGKTQRPTLQRALREVKAGRDSNGEETDEEKDLDLRRYLSSTLISVRTALNTGAIKDEATKFGYLLKACSDDLEARAEKHPSRVAELAALKTAIANACAGAHDSFAKNGKTINYYRAFSEASVDTIVEKLHAALEPLGGLTYAQGPDESCPVPFYGPALADQVQRIAQQENSTQFLDFLVMRMRTMLADSRMKAIMCETKDVKLDKWLEDHIGADGAASGTTTVIDLSLVPAEVVHIMTAVIARMVFEALQRYRNLHASHRTLPTVMVMEEAHTFIRRYRDDAENQDASAVCCQVFEKIAREGRKFGLGLVLSSQRPSELSPTVLSQCNTFLLHRISNDKDQDLVHRFVPDNLKGLLRELPTLSSQNAILLGWASELPVLVRMQDLPRDQQPQSEDPDFWEVWTGKDSDEKPVARSVDWKALADDWQGKTAETDAAEHREGAE